MTAPADITRARVEARMARIRLTDNVAELRARLSPSAAAADARDRAVEAVSDARDRAVAGARRRPLAAVGVAAGIILLLAIRPARRVATAIGRAAWRNRGPIGRFIETKRSARKDTRP